MVLFDPDLTKRCINITDEIMNNSFADIFILPVDPVRDGAPNYFNIIKNPQCLSQIKKTLKDKQYTYLYEWKRDMELVFTNAILFNGETSLIAREASSLMAQFRRLTKDMYTGTKAEWFVKINHYYQKLNLLMSNPPKIPKVVLKPLDVEDTISQKELQLLSEATLSLTTGNDVLQIIQLLNSFGLNLNIKNKEIVISLKELPPVAIKALTNFVKERFKVLGLSYPK
ncbi:hypothetical protein M9Y10_044276 [Tritrichomonas musculus]|uniref:Bromo domain-containing protein n=1 Tax=Tritrichomonas musculus TaxID=1915356 RepID=A0ABR2K2J0_9EUKA